MSKGLMSGTSMEYPVYGPDPPKLSRSFILMSSQTKVIEIKPNVENSMLF